MPLIHTIGPMDIHLHTHNGSKSKKMTKIKAYERLLKNGAARVSLHSLQPSACTRTQMHSHSLTCAHIHSHVKRSHALTTNRHLIGAQQLYPICVSLMRKWLPTLSACKWWFVWRALTRVRRRAGSGRLRTRQAGRACRHRPSCSPRPNTPKRSVRATHCLLSLITLLFALVILEIVMWIEVMSFFVCCFVVVVGLLLLRPNIPKRSVLATHWCCLRSFCSFCFCFISFLYVFGENIFLFCVFCIVYGFFGDEISTRSSLRLWLFFFVFFVCFLILNFCFPSSLFFYTYKWLLLLLLLLLLNRLSAFTHLFSPHTHTHRSRVVEGAAQVGRSEESDTGPHAPRRAHAPISLAPPNRARCCWYACNNRINDHHHAHSPLPFISALVTIRHLSNDANGQTPQLFMIIILTYMHTHSLVTHWAPHVVKGDKRIIKHRTKY